MVLWPGKIFQFANLAHLITKLDIPEQTVNGYVECIVVKSLRLEILYWCKPLENL